MKGKLLYALLFISFNIFSQNEKNEAEILYSKGITIYDTVFGEDFYGLTSGKNSIEVEAKIEEIRKLFLNNSLEYFNQITNEFPESKFYVLALFEKGNIENVLKKRTESKANFEKLINLKTKDWSYYRNKSLLILAEFEIEDKNYSKAKKYIDERKQNNLNFLCGNESELTENQLRNLSEKCEIGLKK